MKAPIKWAMAGAVLLLLLGGFVLQRQASDDRRIERAIEAFATGTDPAACEEKATYAYLEQVTGADAPYADEICESEFSEPAADSVEVSHVSVDGDRATARVAYAGGLLDGSESLLGLVKGEDGWQIDRRVSFVSFDRAGFRRAYRGYVRDIGPGSADVRCALARERRLSDADLEKALLARGADNRTGIEVACDREGAELRIRAALAKAKIDVAGAACARRELASASDARLVRIQVDPAAYGRLVVSCDPDALADYFERGLSTKEEMDVFEIACVNAVFRKRSPTAQFRLSYEDDRLRAIADRCREE